MNPLLRDEKPETNRLAIQLSCIVFYGFPSSENFGLVVSHSCFNTFGYSQGKQTFMLQLPLLHVHTRRIT